MGLEGTAAEVMVVEEEEERVAVVGGGRVAPGGWDPAVREEAGVEATAAAGCK